MPRPALSLAVVGVDFPNLKGPTRRFEVRLCRPGEPIDLRLEPKNKFDDQAVAVYSCRDVQIGYLPAERAPWIGGMIRKGVEIRAIFQRQTSWGAVIRIAFEGEDPVLPPAHDGPQVTTDELIDPEPEWQPDPEWSET